MTSSNIPKKVRLTTGAVCLTAAASIVLGLLLGPHPATYAAIAVWVVACAYWVQYAFRAVPAEYRENTAEAEASRKALKAMLRTCYSLVAAINDTESVSFRIRREVSGKMAELEESVAGLRGALVSLKQDGPAGSPAGRSQIQTDGAKVSELIEAVSTSLEDMTAVMRDVHHDAKELLSSAGETSYSVSRLDSFLQDMVRSGKELESSTETANRVALEGIKVIEKMERENEATIASVKKAAKSVGTLGMWSQEIGKIIQVIKDIADETNLLALNVAIIASQAGEHGKAFGVVAEEIRGLAERTSSSTAEISDLITTVQTSVSNVTEEMKTSVQRVERGEVLLGNAGKVIEKISDSFESARRVAHEIATKTAEHRMDSNHVVRSFQNVADIARRLDASKSSKGVLSGRGATAAQMLRVLTRADVPAKEEKVPVASYAAVHAPDGSGAPADGAHPRPPERDSLELVDRGVKLLDDVEAYIDSVRDGLNVYFDAVANTSSLIRAIARQLHVPCEMDGFKRCWDEFEHDEEVRRSCPAYGQDDWRCFLSEGVDRTLCGDSSHCPAGCYTCPVFRKNMDSLLPESEYSADG